MHQHRNRGPASLRTFHTLLQYGHAPQISASSSRPSNKLKNNSFTLKSVVATVLRQCEHFNSGNSVPNIRLSVAGPCESRTAISDHALSAKLVCLLVLLWPPCRKFETHLKQSPALQSLSWHSAACPSKLDQLEIDMANVAPVNWSALHDPQPRIHRGRWLLMEASGSKPPCSWSCHSSRPVSNVWRLHWRTQWVGEHHLKHRFWTLQMLAAATSSCPPLIYLFLATWEQHWKCPALSVASGASARCQALTTLDEDDRLHLSAHEQPKAPKWTIESQPWPTTSNYIQWHPITVLHFLLVFCWNFLNLAWLFLHKPTCSLFLF